MIRKVTLLIALLLTLSVSLFSANVNTLTFGAASIANYASCASNAALNVPASGNLTITAWVKTSASTGYIVAKRNASSGDGYELYLSSGKLCANVTTLTGAVGPAAGTLYTVNDGIWHHVALVLSATGGYCAIYVDGKLEKTKSSTYCAGGITNTRSFFIGVRDGSPLTVPFTGDIDEVRLYSTALSSADLATDANTQVTSGTTNLKAAWNMDEASGNLLDIKSTNPLTITGTLTKTTAPALAAAPTITLSSLISKIQGNADFSPATSTSFIQYTSSNTAVATVVNSQIHVVAGGTSTITASQPANLFYNAATSVSQPLTVISPSDATNNYWYYIVYQRIGSAPNGVSTIVLQDNGDGNALTSAYMVPGEVRQLWKVTAGGTADQYVLTSKAGRVVYWDGTAARFKAGAAGTTATEMKFLVSGNTTYPNSLELQRSGSTTAAMQPVGGSNNKVTIGEYNTGDGGNALKFVSAATIFPTSSYTNRWYRIRNKAYPTKVMAADANGTKLTYQTEGTSPFKEMFRFEYNTYTSGLKIINRATGLAIKDNGTSTQSTLVSTSTAADFLLWQMGNYWSIGRKGIGSGSYEFLHASGSQIVGWVSSADASQWSLELVDETPENPVAPVAPTESTIENPVYYYIGSASDGTTGTYKIDLRGQYISSPKTTDTKLRYGQRTLPGDSALWAVVNESGMIKLKNKATGFYMNGSLNGSTTGDAFTYTAYDSPNLLQYKISSGTANPTIAWNDNLCDISVDQGANSRSAFSFVPVKSDLEIAIDNATYYLSNTTEGNELGQYSTNTRALLQAAITTATTNKNDGDTSNDAAAATVLNLATYEYSAAKNIVKLSSEILVVNQSTDARNNLSWKFTSSGSVPQSVNVFSGNASRWKFLKSANYYNKYSIMCTVSGTDYYVQSDMKLGATAYDKWVIEEKTFSGVTAYRIALYEGTNGALSSVIHQSSSSPYNLINYTTDDMASLWKFNSMSDYLTNTITLANTTYTNTNSIVGNNPGQYNTSSRSTFLSAINTAIAVRDNAGATDQQKFDAANTLITDKATFLASIIQIESSTASTPVWYIIKNVGRVNGATTYVNGFDTQMKCTTTPVLADGTGTGNAAPALKYLFRFEQSSGSYKIINALYPSGEVIGAVNYGTPIGTKWNVTALSGGTNPQNQYKIVATTGTVWHDDAANNVVGYDGIANSASAWFFEKYTGSVNSLYSTALSEVITSATNLKNNTVEGSTFGQFPAAARTTFQTAIADAQTVYDNIATKTGDEIMAAISTLTAAITTYKGTIITDKSTLLSANADKYRWYTIKSTSTSVYAISKGISTTGRALGNKFTFETVSNPVSDAQLFRFEISGNDVIIINKVNGYYMATNGAISATSGSFALNLLSDGYSYNIKPSGINPIHAQESGSDIVNWSGDVGSSSAWVLNYQKETPKVPEFSGSGNWSSASNWVDNAKPNTYNDILVSGNVTLDEAVTILSGKKITVAAGKALTVSSTLTNNGSMVLESDANGTATITGDVSGTATIKQYLPSGADRTWWYLSSPVSGAVWSVFGSNQVGTYSEADRSYTSPYSGSETLTAGKGYVVKMGAAQAAATYEFANLSLNNGDISVPLTRTVTGTLDNRRGFNLVGNPYPSYLNWALAYAASSNVRPTIWFRTKGTGSMEFHTYNASLDVSSPASATRYIPPMQAFWVKVDADPVSPATVSNGSLSLTNAMRSHAVNGTTTALKTPALIDRQLIRLVVNNGVDKDETVIATNPNASNAFDLYDSEKMTIADKTEIFTFAGTEEVVINGVKTISEGDQFVLGFRTGQSGVFNLVASQLENISSKVVLVDKLLGTETELNAETSYTFSSDAVLTYDRFSLQFRSPAVVTDVEKTAAKIFVYPVQSRIEISGTSAGQIIRVFNTIGQQLVSTSASDGRTQLQQTYSPGVYLVSVNNEIFKVTVK